MEVKVSRPKFETVQGTAVSNTKTDSAKCVIKGVPLDWSEVDIEFAAECLKATRFLRPTPDEPGKLTKTVMLEYNTTFPIAVKLNFTLFKTHQYIPRPMVCKFCQVTGHTAKHCRRSIPTCARCGKTGHALSDCEANTKPHCANCKGDHEATSRICPRYIQTQAALALRSKGDMTYAAALKVIRQNGVPAGKKNKTDKPTHIEQKSEQKMGQSSKAIEKPAHPYTGKKSCNYVQY